MAKTTQAVDDNTEENDSLDAELESYKRRYIKLEATVYSAGKYEEDTEKLVRNMFITKMQIFAKDVNTIRFERIHRIPTKPTSQRSQDRPRPIIVRFSHFHDKEFEKRFLKNLKGTQIGVLVDFPKRK